MYTSTGKMKVFSITLMIDPLFSLQSVCKCLRLMINQTHFLLFTFFPITHRFNQAVRTEKMIQFWILMKLHGYDL